MRTSIGGLATSRPLVSELPTAFQDDRVARRLTEVFDDAFAPILSTIDNLDVYLDPWLTPEDFLVWLAGWVAASLDENWTVERQRAFVARSASFHRRRGTTIGLAEHVRALTDSEVEIVDNGAVAWSQVAASSLPGSPVPYLTVRVMASAGADFDVTGLDAIVAVAKPAHVPHTLEVVRPKAP